MMDTYTIHTLAILRSEIKNYNAMKIERRKAIECYVGSLRVFQDRLYELNEELLKVKSPGGDGLGGFVSESSSKYNYIIEQKEKVYKEQRKYIIENFDYCKEEADEWTRRIKTVEWYLGKLNEKDKDFIEDLYISPMKFKKVMEKWEIENNGDLYRKANNILRKAID